MYVRVKWFVRIRITSIRQGYACLTGWICVCVCVMFLYKRIFVIYIILHTHWTQPHTFISHVEACTCENDDAIFCCNDVLHRLTLRWCLQSMCLCVAQHVFRWVGVMHASYSPCSERTKLYYICIHCVCYFHGPFHHQNNEQVPMEPHYIQHSAVFSSY